MRETSICIYPISYGSSVSPMFSLHRKFIGDKPTEKYRFIKGMKVKVGTLAMYERITIICDDVHHS